MSDNNKINPVFANILGMLQEVMDGKHDQTIEHCIANPEPSLIDVLTSPEAIRFGVHAAQSIAQHGPAVGLLSALLTDPNKRN
jgi:hypothetical protein